MKTFVTGGAGFIGSHLVDKLLSRGDYVTSYDNLSSGKEEFFNKHLKNDHFRFVESDLLDLKRLKKVLHGQHYQDSQIWIWFVFQGETRFHIQSVLILL